MFGLAAAILLTLAGQQPQRDAPAAAAPAGTAVVRGRVVTPGTRRPVAGAIVRLTGTVTSPSRLRTVTSDAKGVFEFKGLATGIYALVGEPAHYQLQFLRGPGVEVPIADGQVVEAVDLTLARAAAIVGRLVDEFGQPIGGVQVQAVSVNARPGTSAASQHSDEFGRFRLFHLTPGSYYVAARPFSFIDPNSPERQGFLETFYPSTTSRGDAVRIDVRAGDDTDVGDLRVLRGRLLRVRGIVVDSRGRAAQSNRTGVTWSCEGSSTSRSVDAQGRFDFGPEPPGTCRLSAVMRGESGEYVEEHVSQSVTLADTDIDVVLTTRPAVAITGRVVIEDAQARPGVLSMRAENPLPGLDSLRIEPVPITRDLTFTFPRMAGERVLRVQGLGAGLLGLKAVMRGDEDITDIPTEFRQDDQIRVVLGARTSGVQGTVTNDAGKPVWSCTVILFSEDRRTWVRTSTRVQSEQRTDRDGRYVSRVPPGRYYAIAVPLERSMAPYEIDPAVLESLVKEATVVVVAPEEMRVVDLRLSTAGGH